MRNRSPQSQRLSGSAEDAPEEGAGLPGLEGDDPPLGLGGDGLDGDGLGGDELGLDGDGLGGEGLGGEGLGLDGEGLDGDGLNKGLLLKLTRSGLGLGVTGLGLDDKLFSCLTGELGAAKAEGEETMGGVAGFPTTQRQRRHCGGILRPGCEMHTIINTLAPGANIWVLRGKVIASAIAESVVISNVSTPLRVYNPPVTYTLVPVLLTSVRRVSKVT